MGGRYNLARSETRFAEPLDRVDAKRDTRLVPSFTDKCIPFEFVNMVAFEQVLDPRNCPQRGHLTDSFRNKWPIIMAKAHLRLVTPATVKRTVTLFVGRMASFARANTLPSAQNPLHRQIVGSLSPWLRKHAQNDGVRILELPVPDSLDLPIPRF